MAGLTVTLEGWKRLRLDWWHQPHTGILIASVVGIPLDARSEHHLRARADNRVGVNLRLLFPFNAAFAND
jgi:hypothetical protein